MFKLEGNLGLCGAHRTGKTTLAIAISSLLNIPFVRTTTSQVFAQLGLDPAEPMDFQNQFFQNLAIIQPGIPLVYEEGKAALNAAYIEHINILVIGLCSDRRLKTNVFCNARNAIDLEARILNILEHFGEI